MRTVLVTGAGGFTGRHFTAAAEAAGWRVLPVVPPHERAQGALACDLTDARAVRDTLGPVECDAVLHLAGQAFVAHADAEELYRVNLFGTLNLLEALATHARPPRVVLASSANVYGTPAREKIDETTCPAPVSHYGCSKLAMEHMARTWSDRLPLVIARPFNYTGVGQSDRFLIPKIVAHFKRREPVIRLGNIDVWRDFSDVRDVARAYLTLLDAPAAVGRAVNICSGRLHSLREVLELAARASGHDLEIQVDPALVRGNEVPRLSGDPSLLHGLTGWSADIALADTMAWMLGVA